jgi:hypothetical protein
MHTPHHTTPHHTTTLANCQLCAHTFACMRSLPALRVRAVRYAAEFLPSDSIEFGASSVALYRRELQEQMLNGMDPAPDPPPAPEGYLTAASSAENGGGGGGGGVGCGSGSSSGGGTAEAGGAAPAPVATSTSTSTSTAERVHPALHVVFGGGSKRRCEDSMGRGSSIGKFGVPKCAYPG